MSSSSVTPLRDRRPVPLQLREAFRELIRSSGLRPGDQIPSESELAERYAVARGSVREALKLLEQDGLIDVQHGRGRFLSAASALLVSRPITRFESVTEMLAALGYETQNRVVSVGLGRASEDEAEGLGLAPGDAAVRLERLRLHDGEALMFSVNVFPVALLDGEDLESSDFSGSLVEWMAVRGRELVSSAADIQAVACPTSISQFPEVDAGQPWLLITERCVDQQGASVLLSMDYHLGNAFTFHVLRRRVS